MHEIMHVELWLMSKCHVRGGSTFKSRVRPCPAVFTRLKTALILEYTGRVYSFSPPQTGRYPTPCDGTRHPSRLYTRRRLAALSAMSKVQEKSTHLSTFIQQYFPAGYRTLFLYTHT